jgi:hypothetical protein
VVWGLGFRVLLLHLCVCVRARAHSRVVCVCVCVCVVSVCVMCGVCDVRCGACTCLLCVVSVCVRGVSVCDVWCGACTCLCYIGNMNTNTHTHTHTFSSPPTSPHVVSGISTACQKLKTKKSAPQYTHATKSQVYCLFRIFASSRAATKGASLVIFL